MIEAVEPHDVVGFAGDIERFGCAQLHARGEFVRLDAGVESRICLARFGVGTVKFIQE